MQIRLPMNQGIVGTVCTTGKSLNITDPYNDSRFNKAFDLQNNYKTKSILCYPIFDQNHHIVGVVQAINKAGGVFKKDDEDFLHIMANLAGIVIRNSLFYDE